MEKKRWGVGGGGGEGEKAFPIFLLLIDKADIWNSSPIPQWQEDGGECGRGG